MITSTYNKKIILIILTLLVLSFIGLPVFATGIDAAQQGLNATATRGGFETAVAKTPTQIVASVVRILLGLLGVIFMIFIIVSGFQWMSAGGNKTAVEKARTRIINATVGLAIILLAWIITTFVISNLGTL
ncbi:MAG: hypothetical protein AUJ28_01960 [Parcubacteria group bacterium CG1_02_37_51]|uniref:Uncharacterized protein n=2 Tax=Candidatus Komeiliibacteriota TaxID=1817908 RepID=A0A2M8DRI7_9BACT|nr:MAG: hypothetical protein AUJ28_01960 [Parcubacteria group bacterium CG1_02_37_51]PIY94202.1 MAG: hypothetical protein COY67_02985 [Candidatus Komeilibacteria bacterium CG_4_10_14_0_8_um_filter_37_78]PJC02000.1 MAG: hypothetical protein CO073_01735 [Candidatus Komeilibacteria bacterium CG_4_9_14_0_8_um_filter_36_9]